MFRLGYKKYPFPSSSKRHSQHLAAAAISDIADNSQADH